MFKRNLGPAVRWLGACTVATAALIPALAQAETETESITTTAGFVRGLTVDCTNPLDFGLIRVDLAANRTEDATVTMDLQSNVSVTAGNTGVSVAIGSPGMCTLAGSTNFGGTATVTYPGAAVALGQAAGPARGLDPVGTPATGVSVGNLTNTATNISLNDGTVTFNIGGELTIPTELTTDNFGAYDTAITVQVDDNAT